MKKYLALLFLMVMTGLAYGQATTPLPLQGDRMIYQAVISDTNCTGNVTSTGCIVMNTQGATGITVTIEGGWNCGTSPPNLCYLFFEASPSDNGPWVAMTLLDSQTFLGSQTISSNGVWVGNVGGYRKFRVHAYAGFFQAGSTARVSLNVGSGAPPKRDDIRSFNFHATLLSASNPAGLTYPVTQCRDFKNVQVSINATGETPDMIASIETSYTSNGPWINYKQLPIGYNVPAQFNGQISAPYFHIFIPNGGTTAGDITIIGGCKQ